MYPRAFFDTYWRGDKLRSGEVFVAMPFHDEFKPVWEIAIEPAIRTDLRMAANRVDTRALSGSIIVDILDGIAHAAVIFVDISIAREGRWSNQRNGNVMYELGVAHAVRPETDVVVVRSDDDVINFDVSGINVRRYSNTDLNEARNKFAEYLRDALKQRDQAMSLLVEIANQRLDATCRRLMVDHGHTKGFEPFGVPQDAPLDQQLIIRRLLDLGIIRCEVPQHYHYRYVWTDFGKAVYKNPMK